MAKYKVTAATWNGHDEGFIVTDPDVRQEDLDVLVHIGVLALVPEYSDQYVETDPIFVAPETGVAENADLSQ
jgi:hypothetical protein